MDKYLKKDELEDLIFQITAYCLELDPTAAATQSRIRIAWPTDLRAAGSNPGWEREDDVVFLRMTKAYDPYTHLENRKYCENESGAYVERVNVTRCHEITWIFYGPNATDDAEKVRMMLMRDYIRLAMNAHGMYVIPGIDEPRRLDEIDGNQWWHRCDLTARFYEGVVRDFPASYMADVPDISIKGE